MTTVVKPFTANAAGAIEILDTPNTPTIDLLVEVFNSKYKANITAANTLKKILGNFFPFFGCVYHNLKSPLYLYTKIYYGKNCKTN
jgi:hypothetical protein